MNWIVGNLQNALDTWNGKLSEIYTLVTQSPSSFKGGTIWEIIVNINGALQAVGLALLVLFFVIGVVRTCTNFSEIKRPEQALKLFLRFAIAKGIVTYGLDLMLAVFRIIQGIVTTIMSKTSFQASSMTLPQEIIDAVNNLGKVNIIIADDEVKTCEQIENMLKKYSYINIMGIANTDEEEIRITFYELRVKENLTEIETKEFLQLCKNKLENMKYNVYFTGETFRYKQCNITVQPNELLVAIKKGDNSGKNIKAKH